MLLVEMGDLGSGTAVGGDDFKKRWMIEMEEESGRGRSKVIDGKGLRRQHRDELSSQQRIKCATHVKLNMYRILLIVVPPHLDHDPRSITR